MDENGSAWSHDPAARLGPASDAPDGLERLGPGPAPEATPATSGGAVATRSAEDGARDGAATPPSEPHPESGAVGDAEDDGDPPPRWAGGRAPAARTIGEAPDEAAAAAARPRRPERAAGSHSAYWAAAVLIVFATVAGVGLTRRGDGNDASTDDRPPSSAPADDAPRAGDADRATATTAAGAGTGSTTVPRAPTTPGPATAGDVTRAPVVGECAAAVEGTPWQYVYRPCEDAGATVRLTQTLPSPPPAGSRCPEGTDTVAQVTQNAGSAAGAGALWCLRNLSAPHPGDPGAGGGQLVVGDCLGTATNGRSVEVPCQGGDLLAEYRVGWMPDAAGGCPAESAAAIDLQVPFPARFCLEYV